jgi:LacI family fructose operon transcriptional repressor
MSQQHERIAERVLAWALRAVELNDYQPGIEAIDRSFKART